MEQGILDLTHIAAYAGSRADYTQGGGGNISVKLNEREMAIKASGYKLSDITPQNGYVVVDYEKIKQFYFSANPQDGKDYEKESGEINRQAVIARQGLLNLRPSVEVGFHALLKKYVIHTHAVYANLLTCCQTGRQLAEKVFEGKPYGFVWVPYINPGFMLTLAIHKAVTEYEKQKGTTPSVILMQNHGLVVHGDDADEVIARHEAVNRAVCVYFGLPQNELSAAVLKQTGEDRFESETPVVCQYLKKHPLSLDVLDAYPLYPDQLVYLNNTVRLSPEKLGVQGEKAVYRARASEAETLDETLAAYVYVMDKLGKLGLPISVMGQRDVDFINNWEAEKYRRSLAK